MNTRVTATLLASLGMLAGCYQAVPAGQREVIYTVNKLTGSVAFCIPSECRQLPMRDEEKLKLVPAEP